MSDLSNLLGDVYGDHSSADAPPVRREPAAADRVPQAPARLPMVDQSGAESPKPAWTSSPVATPSVSVSAPVPAMAGSSAWNTGDDDIFPKGAKKK